MMGETFPWLALALLGASHGINPGMGWLFAVALGMQEQRAKAVWRALLPLTVGHALAVGAVVLIAALVGRALPPALLRWIVAATLIAFGAFRLLRNTHPRYGRMRMGMRQLTLWSFLMATAHGAGLMVLPVLLDDPGAQDVRLASLDTDMAGAVRDAGVPASAGGVAADARPSPGAAVPARAVTDVHGAHAGHASVRQHGGMNGLLATLVHTAAYLLLTGCIAVSVYRWLGLRWIRAAWVNLDLIWGCALILTGVLTVVAR